MKLIARQPCSFGGEKFYIGNEIPAEYVMDVKKQEQMGVLAVVMNDSDTAQPVAAPANADDKTVTINIEAEEGILPLTVSIDGLQLLFDVLTSNAEEAVGIVEQMEEDDALILLHLADSRKTIKKAAEARAKEINREEGAEEAGEQ